MKKDINILEHIQSYCEDISNTIIRFGKNKELFERDKDYRNSVCMSLLQIGELAGHLTDEFRMETQKTIPWQTIRGMRNLFAHNYGAMDIDRIWETAICDIPPLCSFCIQIIQKHCDENM